MQSILVHEKIEKIDVLSNNGFLTALECTKFVFGRGFAPDSTGGVYDAPQTS